jgi:hypothetical protein
LAHFGLALLGRSCFEQSHDRRHDWNFRRAPLDFGAKWRLVTEMLGLPHSSKMPPEISKSGGILLLVG